MNISMFIFYPFFWHFHRSDVINEWFLWGLIFTIKRERDWILNESKRFFLCISNETEIFIKQWTVGFNFCHLNLGYTYNPLVKITISTFFYFPIVHLNRYINGNFSNQNSFQEVQIKRQLETPNRCTALFPSNFFLFFFCVLNHQNRKWPSDIKFHNSYLNCVLNNWMTIGLQRKQTKSEHKSNEKVQTGQSFTTRSSFLIILIIIGECNNEQ